MFIRKVYSTRVQRNTRTTNIIKGSFSVETRKVGGKLAKHLLYRVINVLFGATPTTNRVPSMREIFTFRQKSF